MTNPIKSKARTTAPSPPRRVPKHASAPKEIGVNLYISETTVKSRLRSIFAKPNVLSRAGAIAVASRRGLVKL